MATTPTLTGQASGRPEGDPRVLDGLWRGTGTGFHRSGHPHELTAAGGVMDAACLASRVTSLKNGPADVQDGLSELGGENRVMKRRPAVVPRRSP